MKRLEAIISGDGDVRTYGDIRVKEIAQHIVCEDGTELSVQGSKFHYCRPRTNDGPYSHVEIGYPSVSPDRSWAKFYYGGWTPDNACDSVYGYVPVELVRAFVKAHGGEAG